MPFCFFELMGEEVESAEGKPVWLRFRAFAGIYSGDHHVLCGLCVCVCPANVC